MGFVLLIPLLLLMYVVLVRPQQQRMRRQRELITSIDVDDEVVTAGGIVGRIVEIADDRVFLEVADDVVIEVLRIAISRRLDTSDYSDPPPGLDSDTEVDGDAPADGDAGTEPADETPSGRETSDDMTHDDISHHEEPAKPQTGRGDSEAAG